MAAIRYRILPKSQGQPEADKLQRNIGKAITVTLFVVPGLMVFLLFLLIPVARTTEYSLYKWNGLGPMEEYVGLENYDRLIHHDVFRLSVRHTLVIMGLSLMIQLPLALLLALLVGRGNLPGRKFFRTLLFIPYVFSEVITAIIWLFVLHPDEGLANFIFDGTIPGFEYVAWLGDKEKVLYAIFAVITWKYFGFHMILYMAGLQGIPQDLEDAARLDGATEARVLRYITLPLLGSTIRLTVYLSIVGSLHQFVIVWLLRQGGPVNASQVLGTYLYKFGIRGMALGYGSSIAVTMFAITLVFSLLYQHFVMRRDYARE